MPNEQAGDGGAGTGNNGEQGIDDGKRPTIEQLQAELDDLRKANKAKNAENATWRKKLDEIEAADKQRQEQELSDAQKAAKRAEEAEAKATQLEAQYRKSTISHAVEIAAVKLNFADPDDAAKLADLASVTIDDDGKVTGVDAALKALSTAKPHLIKVAVGSDINARNRGTQTQPTVEEVAKQKRDSGVYVPF